MKMKMKKSSMDLVKIEGLLRFLAFILLLVAAILTRTDSQTKLFFQVVKEEANANVSKVLIMLVYVYFFGAAYSLAQLIKCVYFTNHEEDQLTSASHFLKWIYFLLDQMMAYVIFGTNCAVAEFATIAIFGAKTFQWMKACDKFTRFCFQFGTSVVLGYVATIILALISAISTFNLFRWYSPNFLCLKPIRIGVVA